MSEIFNPFEKKYKKVENLPEEQRGNFIDSENGFIKREVAEYDEKLKKEVGNLHFKENDYIDLARLEAEQIDILRKRTAEDIENFKINEDGLVTHGTNIDKLTSIINYGLGIDENGQVADREDAERICFNVIGAKMTNVEWDNKKKMYMEKGQHGHLGFGPNQELFGYKKTRASCDIYLVTSLIKKLYPKLTAAILNSPVDYFPIFEQLRMNLSPERGVFNITTLNLSYQNGNIHGFEDKSPHEYSEYGYEKITCGRVRVNISDEKADNPLLQYKKTLGYWAFDGIVIPNEVYKTGEDGSRYSVKQEEVLAEVIAIQNEKLPLEEQLPCYSPDGRCIYNPLLSKKKE